MRLLPVFAIIVLCAGCFPAGPIDTGPQGDSQLLGSFALASGRLGRLTISPSTCRAGDRQFFLGGDFDDEKSGIVIRLVFEPLEGPAVRVFASSAPYDKTSVFRRPECRVFHSSLESTGIRINDVQDYRLTVDVDCTNKDGESFVGKASVTHCH